MRKITIRLVSFLCAMFAYQTSMAQDVVFQEDFENGFGGFVVEGYNGQDGSAIWTSADGMVVADAYGKISEPLTNYLVSPEITLNTGENIVEYFYMSKYFTDDVIKDQMSFVVREPGGEWKQLEVPNLQNSENIISSGSITIPSTYSGKSVQVAFRYYSLQSNTSGTWNIDKIIIKGAGDQVQKADPELSYGVSDMEYIIGSPFEAPVLSNPNNVAVTYSSSDTSVASIDANGVVTILNEGITIIKANSAETENFLAGEASYVLTIKNAGVPVQKVDPQLSYSAAEKEYTIGDEFVAPILENPYNVAVTYSSSDVAVATIDAEGKVTVLAEGTTTIKASSAETDKYLAGEASYVLTVKKAPAQKVDPQLSYSAAEKEYTIGDEFVAPILENPYNVAVTYSSSDVAVATIDAEGKVTVLAEGTTTIKAVSAETDKYLAGEASYVLTVKKAPAQKVDPQLSYSAAEKEYTIGDEFVAPILENPYNVAVTYSSSDVAVATIDAEGKVTVLAEGTTTIKASSAETDKYLAGEASYVLTVKKSEGGEATEEVLFEESFAKDLGEFTQKSIDDESTFWQWFMITQSAYATTGNVAKDSRLISPEIQLETKNVLSLSYRAMDFKDLENEIFISVREVGGEWTDMKLPILNNDAVWTDIEYALPETLDNKKVQFSVRFLSDNGTFCVKNLVVKGVKGGTAPVEKKDPQIAFEKENVKYEIDSEMLFLAPELINPNNVSVKYSSDNIEVASVDELTGQVTIKAEGVAKITATSEETETYKSGTASYTITVTVSTGIEGITVEDLKNGKVYDLQGRRVNKMGKGLYIVNGKKVVVK